MLTDVTTSKFQVGQTWKYKTRAGEEGSTLTVLKVESGPDTGVIVHVALRGIRVTNPHAPGGFITQANRLPMAEEALQKSVTEMLSAKGPETRPSFVSACVAYPTSPLNPHMLAAAPACAAMRRESGWMGTAA